MPRTFRLFNWLLLMSASPTSPRSYRFQRQVRQQTVRSGGSLPRLVLSLPRWGKQSKQLRLSISSALPAHESYHGVLVTNRPLCHQILCTDRRHGLAVSFVMPWGMLFVDDNLLNHAAMTRTRGKSMPSYPAYCAPRKELVNLDSLSRTGQSAGRMSLSSDAGDGEARLGNQGGVHCKFATAQTC